MGEITINVMDLLLGILILAAIGAIITLIVVLVKVSKALSTLPDTMKHVDNVMADIEAITNVASEGAEGAKVLVTKAATTLTGVADVMDSNKGTLKAATSFVNSVTSLASLLKKK